MAKTKDKFDKTKETAEDKRRYSNMAGPRGTEKLMNMRPPLYSAAASTTRVDPQANMGKSMKDFYRSSTFKGLTPEEQELLREWTSSYGLTLPDRVTGNPGLTDKALLAIKHGINTVGQYYGPNAKSTKGYYSPSKTEDLSPLIPSEVNYPSELVLKQSRRNDPRSLAHELGHHYQSRYSKIKDNNKSLVAPRPGGGPQDMDIVPAVENQADAIQQALTGSRSGNSYASVRDRLGVPLDTGPSYDRFSDHKVQVAIDAYRPPGMDFAKGGYLPDMKQDKVNKATKVRKPRRDLVKVGALKGDGSPGDIANAKKLYYDVLDYQGKYSEPHPDYADPRSVSQLQKYIQTSAEAQPGVNMFPIADAGRQLGNTARSVGNQVLGTEYAKGGYLPKKMFLGGMMDVLATGVGALGKNAPALAMTGAGIATGNPMLALSGVQGLARGAAGNPVGPLEAGLSTGASVIQPGFKVGDFLKSQTKPGSKNRTGGGETPFDINAIAANYMLAGGPVQGSARKYAKGGKLMTLPGGILEVGGKSHAEGGTLVEEELGLDRPVELEKGETVAFINKGRGVNQTNSAGGKQAFVFSKRLRDNDPNSQTYGKSFAQIHKDSKKTGEDPAMIAYRQEAQKTKQPVPQMGGGGWGSRKKDNLPTPEEIPVAKTDEAAAPEAAPEGFDFAKTMDDLMKANKSSALEQVADFVPGAASIAGSFLAPKPKMLSRTIVNTNPAMQALEALPTRVNTQSVEAENRAASRAVLGNRGASSNDIKDAHSQNLKANEALYMTKENAENALRSDKYTKQANVQATAAGQQATLDARVKEYNVGNVNADQDARTAMRIQGAGSLAQGVYNREGRRRDAAWREAQAKIMAAGALRPGPVDPTTKPVVVNDEAGGGFDPATKNSSDNTNVADPVDNAVVPAAKAAVKTEAAAVVPSENAALYDAVQSAESNGNPNAVSSADAYGLMQIQIPTAKDPGYGVDNIFRVADSLGIEYSGETDEEAKRLVLDAKVNRKFGENFLDGMIKEYGDRDIGLAAYNWGTRQDRVPDWIDNGAVFGELPIDTQEYINAIRKDLGEEELDPTSYESMVKPKTK